LTAAHCNPRAPLALLHMAVQTYVMSHCNALLTVYGRAPQRPVRELVRAVAPRRAFPNDDQHVGGWRRFSSKRPLRCTHRAIVHCQLLHPTGPRQQSSKERAHRLISVSIRLAVTQVQPAPPPLLIATSASR
jgi:hypothetical protein